MTDGTKEKSTTKFGDIRDQLDIKAPGDHLIRATGYNGGVRAMALRLDQSVADLSRRLELSPAGAGLLGELLAAAAFLGADLKNEDAYLSMTCRSEGFVRQICAVCNAHLELKGSLIGNDRCEVALDGDRVHPERLLEQVQMNVIKYLGRKDGGYMGTVEHPNGQIGTLFVTYLNQSEQRRSFVTFGLTYEKGQLKGVGALFAEPMPDCDPERLESFIARAEHFPALSSLMDEFTPDQWLDLLLGDPEIQYLERRPLRYHCPCSAERFSRSLLTLGASELETLAKDPQGIHIRCEFCGRHYHFSPEELLKLKEESLGKA